MDRRSFAAAAATLPLTLALARVASAQERSFAPRPGRWRSFEITTRLEIVDAAGAT